MTQSYSSKWMTYKEVAAHFRVSEATVRLGRGVFSKLRRVPLTAGRTVVLRADVEKLDREMVRAAFAPSPAVVSIEEGRKRKRA
ncbi:MAG TPA: hypothetical protein VGX48_17830 [Pyrinomonadaceae bacterium]|jgi:electron transfer flavoprotein alpha/beta subunit|nr:hypothetical protein [Pyrinomonadaceae bacterium]